MYPGVQSKEHLMPPSMPMTNGSGLPMPPSVLLQQQQQQQQQQIPTSQSSGYQQAATQQMPRNYGMPSYDSNLAANAMLAQGGGMSVGNGKRNYTNMTEILSQSDAEDKELIKQLREDFDTVSSMTLLDDEDVLYTLLIKSPSFINNEYLLNQLLNIYKQKYSDLFQRYPSLYVWSSYCLAMMIYLSENKLRNSCCSTSYNIPQATNSTAFNIVQRKRVGRAINTTDPKRRNTQLPEHPFLANKVYLERPTLFKLGQVCKYCVPSEFSLLFVTCKADSVVKIINGSDKTSFRGIRGTFSRAVIVSIDRKQVSLHTQNFTFDVIPLMNSVGRLVQTMSGFSTEQDCFALGIKQNLNVEFIEKGTISKYRDLKSDELMGHILAPISTFQCTASTAKTVDIRTYTNVLYYLSAKLLNLKSDSLQLFEEQNQSRREELEVLMDKYDEEMQRLNPPTTIVPSTSKEAATTAAAAAAASKPEEQPAAAPAASPNEPAAPEAEAAAVVVTEPSPPPTPETDHEEAEAED